VTLDKRIIDALEQGGGTLAQGKVREVLGIGSGSKDEFEAAISRLIESGRISASTKEKQFPEFASTSVETSYVLTS